MTTIDKMLRNAGQAMAAQAERELARLLENEKLAAEGATIVCQQVVGRPDLGETYLVNGKPLLWFGPVITEQVHAPYGQLVFRATREIKRLDTCIDMDHPGSAQPPSISGPRQRLRCMT